MSSKPQPFHAFLLAVLCMAALMPAFDAPAAPPAQPNKLVFTTEPANGAAGATLAAISVSVEDQQGNVITTDNTTQIKLTLSVLSVTLNGTTTQTVVNGVATFADLSIDTVGTGYTLFANSVNVGPPPDQAAISTPFDITAGTATKLAFVQQPTNVFAGEYISPAVTVAVQDAGGNTVTSDNSTVVTISIPLCGNPITLEAETASAGIATFPSLRLNTAATGDLVDATAAGLTTDTSATFDVLANTDRVFWDGFDDPLCTP